jgi:hypothetical protein
MCARRLVVSFSLAVLLVGCSGGAQSAETGSTITSVADRRPSEPESLALVDQSSEQTRVDLDIALPAGTTESDLPDTLVGRVELLTDWLREFEPARNVGNLPISAAGGQGHEIEFLVRTGERDEAETLCPMYENAMAMYTGSLGESVEIWLSGWVPNEVGVFADPGWARVSCIGSSSR